MSKQPTRIQWIARIIVFMMVVASIAKMMSYNLTLGILYFMALVIICVNFAAPTTNNGNQE